MEASGGARRSVGWYLNGSAPQVVAVSVRECPVSFVGAHAAWIERWCGVAGARLARWREL